MTFPTWQRVALPLLLAALAGCAQNPGTSAAPPEAAPQAAACPKGTPDGARCLRGQDSANAHYLIVIPAQWNKMLVVHAHGGPTPTPATSDEPSAPPADAPPPLRAHG